MMLRRNMDELFNIPLAPHQIAANFACVCNLDKSTWAPDDWYVCLSTYLERIKERLILRCLDRLETM